MTDEERRELEAEIENIKEDTLFKELIKTEDRGMDGGSRIFDIEDLYQLFKERFIRESQEVISNTEDI